MWLVVGLGNPGDEYAATRHNAGFMLVERLARAWNVELRGRLFKARTGLARRGGEEVLLALPKTFMNRSGLAVRAAGRDQLASLLAGLPERYRVPVVLRHVDDLSYAELAEVLGRPEGTLKAQVHRGLALLRAAAAGTGLEEMTA